MTPPRRVLPGASYLITRRCSERRFFLKPSRATNEIFLYVLALAARRYGILVHAFCVLSNHCHLIITDLDARLPAFMQYLESLVARAVNASLGRFEGFWATDGSYSAVEPVDPSDVVAKTAYVLADPVAAGLVRRGADWPGLWTAHEQIGGAKLTARRPKVFFDPKSSLPEAVELELTTTPGFDSARSSECFWGTRSARSRRARYGWTDTIVMLVALWSPLLGAVSVTIWSPSADTARNGATTLPNA